MGVTCHCTATVNHLVELVRFAKTLNRSVTGSINELIKFAEYMLADDDISPYDVGFKLNDILFRHWQEELSLREAERGVQAAGG